MRKVHFISATHAATSRPV